MRGGAPTGDHVHSIVADFILDLLPSDKRARFNKHVATCPDCKKALAAEQELVRRVRESIAAREIDRSRLRNLMPAVSTRKSTIVPHSAPVKQLAFAACLLVVFISGMNGLFSRETKVWTSPSATAFVATEVSIGTPAASSLFAPAPLAATNESNPIRSFTVSGANYDEGPPRVTPAPAPADMRN